MAVSCSDFADYLSRKAEHLDDVIIRALHPVDTWVGHVNIGRFKPEDGVEHTFDRFENVFPNLSAQWLDVQATSCVGKPCDPDLTKIGLGFTRDSYRLQQVAYATDLLCWDLIMTADRAKQQFAHYIKTLRRASSIISSHRLRTEGLRIARQKWSCANNTLTPITATWNAAMTQLTITTTPTSLLQPSHLQRRVQPQIRYGALGEELNKGGAPMLELVTPMDEIWNLMEGNPTLSDHWRFNDFGSESGQFYKYGWTGKVGNYGLRDDTFSLRFNINSVGPTGTVLDLVLPYTNVAATQGIREDVNNDYDNARVQATFIWHRNAMTALVRDTTAINPEMPFAARDFAGKWRFAMNNLVCADGTPVDNSWGNKGRFQAMWSQATKAEYPELAEVFFHLRQPACIVDKPPCADDPGYPAQNYSSSNELCPDQAAPVVLTFPTALNAVSGSYQIDANTIFCNGIIPVAHDQFIAATRQAMVDLLNAALSALGTWAVSGTDITLTTTHCTTATLPFVV